MLLNANSAIVQLYHGITRIDQTIYIVTENVVIVSSIYQIIYTSVNVVIVSSIHLIQNLT